MEKGSKGRAPEHPNRHVAHDRDGEDSNNWGGANGENGQEKGSGAQKGEEAYKQGATSRGVVCGEEGEGQ